MPEVFSTLTRPGGAAKANEVIRVRLFASTDGEAEGFVASSQAVILDEYSTLTNGAGRWSFTLVANSLITPANTTYQVIQPGLNGTKVTETFVVPDGAGPYWLGDILADPPSGLPLLALDAHEAAADPHPTYLTAPDADASYVTLTTAQIITGLKTHQPAAGTTVGLIVKAAGGQTAALQEWQDSSATVLARVLPSGVIRNNPIPSSSEIYIGADAANSVALEVRGYFLGWAQSGAASRGALGAIVVTNFNTGRHQASIGGDHGLYAESRSTGLQAVVVRGLPGQSAALQEWQNSAGTVLAHVGSDGLGKYPRVALGGNHIGDATPLSIVGQDATIRGAVIRGAASQSADLQQWQNSTGTVLARITSYGTVEGGTGSFLLAPTSYAAHHVRLVAQGAAQVPLVVKGAASQTEDLQQWQNSAGSVLANITAAGRFAATFAEGIRTLELGAADSAGAGFRTVRVPN